MRLNERPSRSIELEVGRFINLNSNKNSGEDIAADVFESIKSAIETSRMTKLDKLEFWLELENLIINQR